MDVGVKKKDPRPWIILDDDLSELVTGPVLAHPSGGRRTLRTDDGRPRAGGDFDGRVVALVVEDVHLGPLRDELRDQTSKIVLLVAGRDEHGEIPIPLATRAPHQEEVRKSDKGEEAVGAEDQRHMCISASPYSNWT
jgi:hypothetical protein